MAPNDLVQAFEARLALYNLDDRGRRILAQVWPVIAPSLEHAIDDNIAAASRLPHIGPTIAQHASLIKKLELTHLRALFGGKFDRHYIESCRDTVQQETAIGLDARMRSTASNFVLKRALDALARRHRFSPTRLAEHAKVISQTLNFDVATAMTLHRQASEQAALERRKAIDEAIGDFGGAIGEVVEAIKEASASLAQPRKP